MTNLGDMITISTIKIINHKKIDLVEKYFAELKDLDNGTIEKQLLDNSNSKLTKKEKRYLKKHPADFSDWLYDDTYFYFIVGGILDKYGYAYKYGKDNIEPAPDGYQTCKVKRIIGKWYYYATV